MSVVKRKLPKIIQSMHIEGAIGCNSANVQLLTVKSQYNFPLNTYKIINIEFRLES